MTPTEERENILNAAEHAPSSGPVADWLVGVWTMGGWYVCAACVGRITARGCGHTLKVVTRVAKDDDPQITGECTVCQQTEFMELVAELEKEAYARYEKGWDIFIECYEAKEWGELLKTPEGRLRSKAAAMREMQARAEAWEEKKASATY